MLTAKDIQRLYTPQEIQILHTILIKMRELWIEKRIKGFDKNTMTGLCEASSDAIDILIYHGESFKKFANQHSYSVAHDLYWRLTIKYIYRNKPVYRYNQPHNSGGLWFWETYLHSPRLKWMDNQIIKFEKILNHTNN